MADPTRRSLLATLLTATAARAETAAPTVVGKPILTVSGRIARPNVGAESVFDRTGLQALGEAGFDTSTPWYSGPNRFDGVPMTAVMAAVGAEGATVRAIALNDYTTDIPMSDFARYGVLLALRRNGVDMPVRDKGPLFIIYPFDRSPELQTQQFYSRSAWQVSRLVVI